MKNTKILIIVKLLNMSGKIKNSTRDKSDSKVPYKYYTAYLGQTSS